MKSNRNFFHLLIFFLSISNALAQKGGSPPTIEEEDYYLFPIQPGETGSLAGTMGELRSTHFHTGIDIRTGGVTGLPVHAAAEGDIVRVAVNTRGYGNALYILHPNGTHTVYAHLEKFNGPVAEYLKEEQYRRKQWDLDLYFPVGKFKVNKGDTIAFSGNSGSSGGPHLHFDLRDAKHDLLNPLKYNFEEVRDERPPVVRKLAIKTMDLNSRIDDQFGRKEFEVVSDGKNYIIDEPIEAFGLLGLEIYAYDLLDGANFRTGITEIDVLYNGVLVHSQEINTFSFSDQRNILVHMPYKELQTSSQRFHKLYIDDGNELKIYDSKFANGIRVFEENCVYPIEIVMRDTYHNESKLSFKIKCKKPDFNIESSPLDFRNSDEPVEVLLENTLKITVPTTSNTDMHNSIMMYVAGVGHEMVPEYVTKKEAIYLWDMRLGIPDSADYCGIKKVYSYQAMIPAPNEFNFHNNDLSIHFPVNSLFDTLYLNTSYENDKDGEFFKFGDIYQPIRRYLAVTLKPKQDYNENYYAVYAVDQSNKLDYEGGQWQNGMITFSTREFGKYTIAADSIPPVISPVKLSKDVLKFKISDAMSGVHDYEVKINGKWVLMHYDYKRDLIWSEKLYENENFDGEVVLRVWDNQGNEQVFRRKI